MLIDEFDYIIDPTKSNYNITNKQNKISIMNEFNLLKPKNLTFDENVEHVKNGIINEMKLSEDTKDTINKDIKNIIEQINMGKLKYNINWGIHPNKCIAIPYRCKDMPLLDSNFSSIFLTIYLTLHYHIVLNRYNITDVIFNYIKNNNLYEDLSNGYYYYNNIIDQLNQLNGDAKIKLFDKIFNKIFSNHTIATEQKNTSFIDILNIDNVFKIGYSGTVNIDLPDLITDPKFIESIIDDDELINVYKY